MIKRVVALLVFLSASGSLEAQEIAGDWQGLLQIGPAQLQLVLHVLGDGPAGYRATLDSPDQNALGMQVGTIALDGVKLTFSLPQIGGAYEGTLHESGTTVVGLWTQGGTSLPLELQRRPPGEPAARVARPGEMDGAWSGSVDFQGQTIEMVVRITTFEDGLGGTMDIPAQNARGLPITRLTRDNASIHLEMRQLAAVFDGTLDAGGGSISGTWRQRGYETQLVLRKP